MNPLLKPFALRKPIKKAKSPRTKIRRRTKSRAKEEAIYRKRVKEWSCELPESIRFKDAIRVCEVSLRTDEVEIQNASQVHHKFGRRGKLLLWEQGWIAVSQQGHDWINAHPKEARMLDLICEVGQFNNQKLVK